MDEAARALGISAKILRAIEWDRRDLLGDAADTDRMERRYAGFLGLRLERPASSAIESPPSRRNAKRFMRGALAALARLPPLLVPVLLAPLIVITLVTVLPEVVAGVGDVEVDGLILGITLGLLLLSCCCLPRRCFRRGSSSDCRSRRPDSRATGSRWRWPRSGLSSRSSCSG